MKHILIVGGSRGIGQAILEREKADNHCVNFSRNAPDNISGIEHHSLNILTDELPELEKLDALVYCPGSINLKPIQSLKESDLQEDFEINTLGGFRLVKHYLPLLKKSESASVIMFSTVAAITGMPFHISVAAAKGAVESMVRAMAAELAPKVRVNCIAPSLTDTPLADRLLKNDQQKENAAGRHPMKRYGVPNDLASAAHFLLHEESSWVTGQIIRVDGGLSTIHL